MIPMCVSLVILWIERVVHSSHLAFPPCLTLNSWSQPIWFCWKSRQRSEVDAPSICLWNGVVEDKGLCWNHECNARVNFLSSNGIVPMSLHSVLTDLIKDCRHFTLDSWGHRRMCCQLSLVVQQRGHRLLIVCQRCTTALVGRILWISFIKCVRQDMWRGKVVPRDFQLMVVIVCWDHEYLRAI